MNGTEDPMNPYAGGVVALYGLLGNRGRVLSSEETVAYWAELAGYEDPPQERTLPDLDPGDGSRVVVHEWRAPGRARVALYAVEGGGHSAPHPEQRIPRLFGRTNGDISAAEEIWEFFREAPPLGPRPGRS
jgi:polyhydroxybutyrate depolymerase